MSNVLVGFCFKDALVHVRYYRESGDAVYRSSCHDDETSFRMIRGVR